MKEESPAAQQVRRLLKQHTTADSALPSPHSPCLLRLPVNAIRMPESPQKQNRIHQITKTPQILNSSMSHHKMVAKASRFRVDEYNEFQEEKQEDKQKVGKQDRKKTLFNIRTMNISKRIRYEQQQDEQYPNLLRVTTFAPPLSAQLSKEIRTLQKCQSLNSSMLSCDGREARPSIRRLPRHTTLQFTMTESGPS